ncbi:hypothetical protein FQA39_LY18946 [Lamprigera yunnana]|nr:hypothetical protein FQA39_LY18946 [Lamprigera yunnana]
MRFGTGDLTNRNFSGLLELEAEDFSETVSGLMFEDRAFLKLNGHLRIITFLSKTECNVIRESDLKIRRHLIFSDAEAEILFFGNGRKHKFFNFGNGFLRSSEILFFSETVVKKNWLLRAGNLVFLPSIDVEGGGNSISLVG